MRTYSSIESEFRNAFGICGNFSWCDFRPSSNGNLINASLAILPLASAEETHDKAWDEFRRIWLWLQKWASHFDEGDVIQVVVGFPKDSKPSGQIFKGEFGIKDISKLPENFDLETFVKYGGRFQELFNWSSYTKTLNKI
jgi:neutral trehalase